MRNPIPDERLVLYALLGVVLTGALSVALAAPDAVPGVDTGTSVNGSATDAALGADAPAPNESFTPRVVKTSSRYGEEEHEEYEEYEDDEYEEHEENEDRQYDEEYEDDEYGEDEYEEHDDDGWFGDDD